MTQLQHQRAVIGWVCGFALSVILFSLPGCGGSNEQGPTISTKTTPPGTAVNLVWEPVKDPGVIGYYIHYGKRSPNQPGSCTYDYEVFVSSTHEIVSNLDEGAIYYFAVSAYNGLESTCSNEVFTHK